MEIRVVRNHSYAACVQSQVLIDGAPKFYGLEPPLEPFHGGPVCIPEGSYEVWLRWSPKHSMWVPAVIGVQGRMDIEIHSGNEPQDTTGCLCVGCGSQPGYITESRFALGALMEGIKQAIPNERVVIRYVNQFAESAAMDGVAKSALLAVMAVLWFFGMGVALKAQAQGGDHGQHSGGAHFVQRANVPTGELQQHTGRLQAEGTTAIPVGSDSDTGMPAEASRLDATAAAVSRRAADGWFYVAEGLRWGAAVSDWETTRHFVNETSCTESAPGFGPKPSAARIYGIAVPIEAGFTVGNLLIRRHMRRSSRADRAAALVIGEVPLLAGHAFAAWRNGKCFGPGFAK